MCVKLAVSKIMIDKTRSAACFAVSGPLSSRRRTARGMRYRAKYALGSDPWRPISSPTGCRPSGDFDDSWRPTPQTVSDRTTSRRSRARLLHAVVTSFFRVDCLRLLGFRIPALKT